MSAPTTPPTGPHEPETPATAPITPAPPPITPARPVGTRADPPTPAPAPAPVPAISSTELATVRELLIKAHPQAVPQLIAGDSIAALQASIAPAEQAYRELAGKLAPSVPAGGAPAVPVDPAQLSPTAKMAAALAAKKGASG